MTLYEEMNDAVKYGEPFLAYTIFWAIQNGHVSKDDNWEGMKSVKLDIKKIRELQTINLLGIDFIKLYAARDGGTFYFIFAENEQAVKGFFFEKYGRFPQKVTDAHHKLDTEMWDEVNGYQSFRQMRDREIEFPAMAAVYREETYEEVEKRYLEKFGLIKEG